MSLREVHYDDEIDTVAGVTELLETIRKSGEPMMVDWRYAHTLKLQIDWLTEQAEETTR